MNTHTVQPRPRPQHRTRVAFTLTELLVAIAAIALLTTGIGRIFSSVSKLITVGSAVSEIDQTARALEKQLRDDFEAFNRMRPEDTFLAIRMREVGDINHNGVLQPGDGEIPLYLSIKDRDADRRDIGNGTLTAPYEPGSRAVTRRLDEIMFIGANLATGYPSYEIDSDHKGDTVKATTARIYYGQGLRPLPDPTWPPVDVNIPLAPRAPFRSFLADGDFGSSPNPSTPNVLFSQNRFDPSGFSGFANVTGRNEFATQWPLLRQSMLLYGGDAAGYASNGTITGTPIGFNREIAPLIRDVETEQRVPAFLGVFDEKTMQQVASAQLVRSDRSNFRRIRNGRVDICVQDNLDVKRWLEGQSPVFDPQNPDLGQPFGFGRLTDLANNPDGVMDATSANNALWIRTGNKDESRAAIQRGIAGMFNRILADPSPPVIDRAPNPARNDPDHPEDALMDLHAVLASNCSNFEIAWGDGSTALQDIDFDNDGVIDIHWGETVWYDMSVLDTSGGQPLRSLFEQWSNAPSGFIDLQGQVDEFNEAEITSSGIDPRDNLFYTGNGYADDTVLNEYNANALPGAGGSVPNATEGPAYSTFFTGGAPNKLDEVLVIFPFRQATDAGWGAAVSKRIMIRVRVTLHDSLGRLPEGKDFEFIFTLDPKGF